MAFIQSEGPTTLLSVSGSTASTGDWYQVHGKVGRLAFTALLNASSAGATATSSISIDVSNDGTYRIDNVPLTFSLTNTSTDYACQGACFATSFGGHWKYVRARLVSCTTSTVGSAGSPSVTVVVNGGYEAA